MKDQSNKSHPLNEPSAQLEEHQMNMLMSQLQNEQNLQAAIVGGLVASLAGAATWAVITAITGYQIGWMAVGIGFLVGFAVRQLGKGVDKIFGIVGAVLALLGCLMGNAFTVIYFLSVEMNTTFWQLLSEIDLNTLYTLMIETFDITDLLFYGIAVYEGYRISFRQISESDMAQFKQS